MITKEKTEGIAELVPAVDKAFRILEVLKGHGRELTIVEIARALDLNKSSVHKLLVTLSHFGAVQRDESSKKYRLGIALAEYGSVVLSGLDIRRAARPYLKSLMETSGETACLAVLQGTKVMIVDKAEPLSQIHVAPHVGWRFPATLNAMGKAMLAWLPPDKVAEILRREGLPARTSKSITDLASYDKELRATRERGYAIEWEEFHEGVNGVAAPILDHRLRVLGAISVGGPVFRLDEQKMAELGRTCMEAAREISRTA